MKAVKLPEDRLVEEGLITSDQLAKARAEATRSGLTVRQAMLSLKFMDADKLAQWLAQELQLPRVQLKSYLVDSKVLALVPEELARRHKVLPLFKVGEALTVATADPLNLTALDELRLKTGRRIDPVVATESEILQGLEEYYGTKAHMDELVSDLSQVQKLQSLSSEAPVVRFVNVLLTDALRNRASDIHLEAERQGLRVRFRVDGLLREFTRVPKDLEAPIVSRVKILADLDISERRKPQDGRFRMMVEGHELDLRVSIMPAIEGETVVLRLLDTQGIQIGLEKLGMSSEMLGRYQELLKKTWGILLVTGPTGSGKTTTLYSSLAKLNSNERNIVTIEDPVEYRLNGVRQIPVNPAVGLTFATGLRSILRQDPNVIMVGEIRDRETAEIAIQAALTGHLVFSTLHTNDAPTAVTRLLDMGIEPFLVASSLTAVVGQRLIRTLCDDCKAADPGQAQTAQTLGFSATKAQWMRGAGCRHCGNAGYWGRIGVFELMAFDEQMHKLTLNRASTTELRSAAQNSGMKSFREDGLIKAAQGLTTIDEVIRVTQVADA